MRPLDGVRVLELGQYISAPYCSMLLADQGAEVIKVERPGVGDPRRTYDPLIERGGKATSGGFLSYNRNKRSIAINLGNVEGQQILRELAMKVDVIVENLRPGVMDSMDLSPQRLCQLNPRLIYAAISGYGRDPDRRGPFSDRPAFDAAIQATAGLMSVTGQRDGPPSLSVVGFADIYTAMSASLSISMALFARERTGVGGFIDQAMFDSVVSLMERALMLYDFTGEVATRGIDRFAPVGAIRASDGYVAVIIPTDEMWRRFCEAIDRPDLISRPDLDTVLNRSALFVDVVIPEAELWSSSRTRVDVVERLGSFGLPAGEVQTVDEIYHSPQVEARRLLMPIDDPAAGVRQAMKTPVTLSGFDEPPRNPPPTLGGDTDDVLAGLLGSSAEQLADWRTRGVIASGERDSSTHDSDDQQHLVADEGSSK
jgi:crotonobetainyl-CoA:carnitine CoA-transferase CaiB-like acyl-CoA transferase